MWDGYRKEEELEAPIGSPAPDEDRIAAASWDAFWRRGGLAADRGPRRRDLDQLALALGALAE